MRDEQLRKLIDAEIQKHEDCPPDTIFLINPDQAVTIKLSMDDIRAQFPGVELDEFEDDDWEEWLDHGGEA